MKIRTFKFLAGWGAAALVTSALWGYVIDVNSNNQPVVWPAGSVTLQVMADNSTVLGDGTTRATTIQAAAQAWNAQISTLQLVTPVSAVGVGASANSVNEIFFSGSLYGVDMDDNTLAITATRYSGAQRLECDIAFNTGDFSWDSYRGPLHSNGDIDIRRVALHELGHVLGLDHPDDQGQSVQAVMNSTISDVDSLKPDDIAGAQFLYGNTTNAVTYTSISFPSTAVVGAGTSLTVNMTNTGGLPWGANHFLVLKDSNRAAVAQVSLNGVNVGGSTQATIPFTAPSTPGSYIYYVQATQAGSGYFGLEWVFTLVVTPVVPPDDIAFNSNTFPSSTSVNATVSFTYNATNVGAQAWGVNHNLVLKDSSHNFMTSTSLNGVGVGGNINAPFSFTAPATAGNYSYYLQASDNSVYFGPELLLTIRVIAPDDIRYNSTTFPTSVVEGTNVSFVYSVTNTGSQTWNSNHSLVLKDGSHAVMTSVSLSGVSQLGGTRSAALSFTAPVTTGTYTYYVQALDNAAGYFGPEVPLTLIITPRPANSIAYNVTTFPASAVTGSTVTFTYTVSNSGAQAWGANHFLVFKDSSLATLGESSLNGTAVDGVATATFTFVAPNTTGTYSYSVRAVEDGVGYFGPTVPLTLTVVAAGQPPPVILHWPTRIDASDTGYYLQLPDPGPGGPFSYQWYKDGVPIPGATNLYFSKNGATTPADAGNYAVTVSNSTGTISSPDIPLIWQNSDPPWHSVGRVGDVLYFLFISPGSIARYDLASESWLPSVSLPGTPTTFCPTPQGVFIAYGTAVVRRTLDLQTETPVATSTTVVNHFLTFGNLVYFLSGSNVVTYDRSTLIAGVSFVATYSSTLYQFWDWVDTSFSTVLGQGFYPTGNNFQRFTIAGDGSFNSETGTGFSYAFSIGRRQFLSADQQFLFDSSGVVYNTANFTYARSLGLPFEDLAFRNDGIPVILRAQHLLSLDQGTFVETGRVTLAGLNYRAFSRGTDTYVFGALTGPGGNPTVTKVAASAFSTATLPPTFNPMGARLSADDMFIDANGVVHVLSRSAHGVVRWSTQSNSFLATIPLKSAPGFSSYAPAYNRFVLAYPDGTLSRLDPATSPVETPFSQLSNEVIGLAALDDMVECVFNQASASESFRIVMDSSGARKFLSDFFYWGSPLAWDSASRRLYENADTHSPGMAFEDVPLSGVLPGWNSTTQGLTAPLRLNQSGTRILSGNGLILDHDLGTATTLTNSVVDGAWLTTGLFTIRAQSGGTQVQKWDVNTSGFVGSLALPGIPLRVFRVDDSKLVVVTSVNGYLAFHTVGSGLSLINSYVNVVPGTSPGFTNPAAVSVPVGSNAQFSVTVSGAPTPTLQWQRLPSGSGVWSNLSNGGSYSGVTTSTLTVSSATLGMNGDQFRCLATNVIGTATSNAATLSVIATVPSFTTQPTNREASPGGTPTFTVAAIGGPVPTLQWQRLPAGGGGWSDLSNGGSYAGVTTTTLTVSGLTLGMSGDQFRCVATNTNGTATSNAATLTVGPLVTGDFNFDRQKDLIWEDTVTGERALWLMHGTVYIGGVSFGVIDHAWRIVGAADFNGDGKTDILWENTTTGDRMIWMMDGMNHVSTVDMGIVSTAWRMAALADFNGDHQTDIMLENTSTGERVVWLMNGTDVASTISYGTIPTAWRIAASADFNHDGQIDIVWENTQTGQHAIWLMNGTIFQSAIDFGSIPTQWRLATVGDFDGDGDVDFFWENTTTGDRALWLMHGTIFSTSIYFGIIPTAWNIAP